MKNVRIAYGTIVNEIKEVSRSYKEAKMALDVGKIFFGERNVIAYSELGIGRLIYQLPIPLCKMFIKEIFDGKSPDDFDEETLTTINKFFENSMISLLTDAVLLRLPFPDALVLSPLRLPLFSPTLITMPFSQRVIFLKCTEYSSTQNSITSGYINVMGYDLSKIKHRKIPKFRRNIGIVFQDFRLLKDRNVYENVAFAQRIIQKSNKEIKKNVPSILAIVGLAGKYKAKPKQLSGGEQQRVALARALVNEPTVLLADEPTGNLDPKNSWEIMKLLEQINENGTTVLVVTHNREIVNAMQKRVVTLKKGVIVSDEEKGGYIDED